MLRPHVLYLLPRKETGLMLSNAYSRDITMISFLVLPVVAAISSITFIMSFGNRSDITEVSVPYRRARMISFFLSIWVTP